jgi:PKD repeat protein
MILTIGCLLVFAPVADAQCEPAYQVSIRADVLAGKAPLRVIFRAGIVGDTSTIAKITWNFDDGNFAFDDLVTVHTYAQAGSYLARFTVEDTTGCLADATVFILVNEDINSTPTARMSATFPEGDAPISVVFNSVGEDTDGWIIKHEWSFGDGSFATGETVVHNYQANGTYLVRLTVTDDRGGKDFTIRSIEIGSDASGLGSDLSSSQVTPTNTSLVALQTCGGLGAGTATLTILGLLGLRFVGFGRRR